ncbi:MAG: hypothetical protein N2319_01825, partial [Candidatus Kapabacteria bacterium]|nr:hypothetical protein [Candidatus Kapabacteria bacterium]
TKILFFRCPKPLRCRTSFFALIEEPVLQESTIRNDFFPLLESSGYSILTKLPSQSPRRT